MSTENKSLIESRLTDQSVRDCLIANDAYDRNFTLFWQEFHSFLDSQFKELGVFLHNILPNEKGKPCLKSCRFFTFKLCVDIHKNVVFSNGEIVTF